MTSHPINANDDSASSRYDPAFAAEGLLDLLNSDFGQSGGGVQLVVVRCELEAAYNAGKDSCSPATKPTLSATEAARGLHNVFEQWPVGTLFQRKPNGNIVAMTPDGLTQVPLSITTWTPAQISGARCWHCHNVIMVAPDMGCPTCGREQNLNVLYFGAPETDAYEGEAKRSKQCAHGIGPGTLSEQIGIQGTFTCHMCGAVVTHSKPVPNMGTNVPKKGGS